MAARPAVPGPWPLKEALGWHWHWSWIGTHSASTFKAEFYKITALILWKFLKLLGWTMCTWSDRAPRFQLNNKWIFWKYVCLRYKSFRFKVLQNVFDPDLHNLAKTPADKGQEVWSSRLISTQPSLGSAWFYCGGLTDSAPATKIKIYYNVKLNLIKCEQLAPAPVPASRLFVLAAATRDELLQPQF